ncbi:MAG: hypothetical protein ACW97A_11475 [Candidatus Thorarchaeota archaeon]
MSEEFRVDALLFLRVLHVLRVILLFTNSIVNVSYSSGYLLPIWLWYSCFFIGDLPLLFAFLKMKSDWELGARVYGLFWTFFLIIWLLITTGYGSQLVMAILWPVIIVEVFVLAKPGSYWSNRSNAEGISPID